MARVLVIEDEGITRSLYKRLLDRVGCAYDMASNLEDARRRMADSGPYDLLLTDLRLPDGHGTDVLAEFRARFPEAKVLVVTGSPLLPTLDFRPEDHGAECLFKPFELEEFTRVVTRLLSLVA